MKGSKKIWIIGGIVLLLIGAGAFWLLTPRGVRPGSIIVTAVPSDVDFLADDMGVYGRYIPGAQLMALTKDGKGKSRKVLTEDFYSARAPEVSFDQKQLIFTGQKAPDDTWQIYMMDLESLESWNVTSGDTDCTDPAWLPDGKILFSRLTTVQDAGTFHALYVCQPDGSEMKQLTFDLNSSIASGIFEDGRILTLSQQQFPSTGIPQYMALRPDGTKAELYYKSKSNVDVFGRIWEGKDGRAYFIEGNSEDADHLKLVSVINGHPLSSRKNWTREEQGDFYSPFPDTSEQLIIAHRPDRSRTFGLYFFSTETEELGEPILLDEEFHFIEPVVVTKRKAPMQLPTIVDEAKDKGTLLCHDSDFSTITVKTNEDGENITSKVQIMGINGLLGEVSVEQDGSFYVEIDADKPVKFQTVNKDGKVLRGPSAWIWVRPGEKRSCVGCHENREMAPENRVPSALYSGMVSIPEGTRSESIVFLEKYSEK